MHETDPYLTMLADQAKALAAREADVVARAEQLAADRAAIAADRIKLDVAREHYQAFLASKTAHSDGGSQNKMTFYGGGPAVAIVGAGDTGSAVVKHVGHSLKTIPLPLRMGAKRRRVLDAVATAGQGQTNREIAEKTGVNLDVVRNITNAECKEGIFARQGDKLYMTPAGLDYINRANEKFGPAPKDPPATRAEGVFN